jgi:hypothetical protein
MSRKVRTSFRSLRRTGAMLDLVRGTALEEDRA